jgi:hypothetical protein
MPASMKRRALRALRALEKATALKECVICHDDVLYENQRIDGCGVKHADCICITCYNNKLEQQNVVKGKLVFSYLHQCVICHTFHDTTMGRYLQTVPDTHQTRWCNDCGNLFHDKPACDEDEIPIDCPSCFDKKEKQREFVECPNPNCKVMNSLISGCDYAVCGRNFNGSSLYNERGTRVDAGCGESFCYGCSQPFKKDVLFDYTCPCYIKGTYPKQYDLAKKQACRDKYYLLEWECNMRNTILKIRDLGVHIQHILQQTDKIPLSQSPRMRSPSLSSLPDVEDDYGYYGYDDYDGYYNFDGGDNYYDSGESFIGLTVEEIYRNALESANLFGIDMNSGDVLPSPPRLQPSPVDVDEDMLSAFFLDL